MHMSEITAKFIKANNRSSRYSVSASISGRKILLFNNNSPLKVNILPYFDEFDELSQNSCRIVGSRLILGHSSIINKNPDFDREGLETKVTESLQQDFNYRNKFTNTRFNYFTGVHSGYICEVWFKAELTQYADHEVAELFGKQDRLFKALLL